MRFECFFFFQAEDGIRDVAVTGVQTCALPISARGERCCTTRIWRPPFWIESWSVDASSTSMDPPGDRKSTRLNSSHGYISYAVFCLKKKKNNIIDHTEHSTSLRCDMSYSGHITA